MLGGELAKGSINIDPILETLEYSVDTERSALLGAPISRGFQGKIVKMKGDDTKVAKLMKLKQGLLPTRSDASASLNASLPRSDALTAPSLDKDTKEVVYLHVLGSDLGIGPTLYGSPFIVEDRSHIAFIMDKVVPYVPNNSDNDALISLFTRAFSHGLVPFDFEYAKNRDGHLIFLDFGVCGLYPSYVVGVRIAIDNDVFLYHPVVRDYFENTLERSLNNKRGGTKTKSNKKKKSNKKSKKRIGKKDK